MRFGPAGLPAGKTWQTVFPFLKKLGLSAFEVQFVYGVRMKPELAESVAKLARKNGIKLSVHAPYYINLCGAEKTIEKSKERIIQSARIAQILNAKVVFHPGFYLDQPKEKAFKKISDAIEDILKSVPDARLAPETMGKQKQFGSLNEILELSKNFENVEPCIDWAHLHARGFGRFKTEQDFSDVLDAIEEKLGKKALKSLHQHFSCIFFTNGNERYHLPLERNEPDFRLLCAALKNKKVNGEIISETPNPLRGAIEMHQLFE